MRNTVLKTAVAAIVLASPMITSEASAKIKEMKFHFVQGPHEDYPVMNMKFDGNKWQWTNKGKHFKPRMKVYFKAKKHKVEDAKVTLAGHGLWALPAGYETKKHEQLVTVGVGKGILGNYQNLATSICKSSGGSKKVVKDIVQNPTFTVGWKQPGGDGHLDYKTKSIKSPMLMKIVCQPYAGPTRTPVALSLKKMKLYTIPAKPKCGKPVKLVGEFHTNKPGKVEFMLYRGDGANQRLSVTTTKGGSGYVKRWSKPYQFNKTTIRKYKLVAIGHKNSTPWVQMHLRCDNTNGYSG